MTQSAVRAEGGRAFEFSVNNFDLIRLLAACQVMVIHGVEHLHVAGLDQVIHILGLFPGVPIFFVTSGYLISASFERTPQLGRYFKNRFLRIYPALWTCLLVSIASLLIFYDGLVLDANLLPWLAAQVTIGQFYNPDFLRGYGVGTLNGSLWTIPVELQFYLVLPFIYPLLRRAFASLRFALPVLAALVIVNVAFNEVMQGRESVVVKLAGVSLAPYLGMFLLGVYFQRHRDLLARWMVGKSLYWLAALVGCALLAKQFGLEAEGNYLNPASMLALAGFTLASAYTRPELARKLLRGNDLSYGVYIYHMVVINVFVHTGAWRSDFSLPAVFAITLAMAALSWLLVEKPALARKNRTAT